MTRWAIIAALAASAAPAPAQVGTWTIRGTGTGAGVSFGANVACNQTVSVTRRARGSLSVAADGTYRAPAGQLCRRSAVIVPDEVGVWRPRRTATRLPHVPHSEEHVPPTGADFRWHHRCNR